jgi:two-component system LytT family sensor kinase
MQSNKRYWFLQFTGWFLYGTIGLLIAGIFAQTTPAVIVMQCFAVVVMLSASHLLRFVIKKNQWTNLPIGGMIIRTLVTNVFLALVANGFVTLFGIGVKVISLENYSMAVFGVYWFQTFLFLTLWAAFYISIKYFQNYKSQEIEKWRLEAAVKDAELIALKAQINPHFLFNALNNIRGLILEDQMKARDMVDNLSELLRYSIQFNNQEKVTVKEEMEVVKKYVELEMVHYEDRLQFSSEIPKALMNAKLPPMIIQLMTENAIKHGISLQKDGGLVKTQLDENDGQLIIQVANTGNLVKNDRQGIGIKNAMERINLLFDKMPDFELTESNGTVTATLKLPLQK